MWKDSKNAIKRMSSFRDTPSLVDLPEKLKIEKTGPSRCSSTFKDAIFRPESEKMTNLQIRRNSRRASVFSETMTNLQSRHNLRRVSVFRPTILA